MLFSIWPMSEMYAASLQISPKCFKHYINNKVVECCFPTYQSCHNVPTRAPLSQVFTSTGLIHIRECKIPVHVMTCTPKLQVQVHVPVEGLFS